MARITPELLARCLDDLREGKASLEAVLAVHPESRDELRSLIETALAIPTPLQVTPSAAFRQRARADLLAGLTSERRMWWQRLADAFAMPSPRFGFVLPLMLALVLGLGGFGGAVYAAQDTLPGDLLYPLKTGVETAQIALTLSESGKAEQYLAQAAERLQELQQAQEQGRSEAINGLARAYANAVAHAEARLARAAAAGDQIDALLAQMEQNLSQQHAALTQAQSEAPPQAQEGLGKAADAAAHGQASAAQHRGQKPNGQGPTTGPQDGGPPTSAETNGAVCTAGVEALDVLISQVRAMAAKDQSLSSKLEGARAALARCQLQAAQGQLEAFLNQLNALRHNCDVIALDYTSLFSQTSQILTGPAGAPAVDVPSAILSSQCDEGLPSNRPEPVGPPAGEPGPPSDRGRP